MYLCLWVHFGLWYSFGLINIFTFMSMCYSGNSNFVSLKFPLSKSYTPDHFQDLVIGCSKSCIFSYKLQNQLCNIYPIKSYREFKNFIKSTDQFCYCFHSKFYQELFRCIHISFRPTRLKQVIANASLSPQRELGLYERFNKNSQVFLLS